MFGRRTHFYPKSFKRFEGKKLVLEKKSTSLVFAIQKLLDCSITSLKISQGMDMKDGVGEMD